MNEQANDGRAGLAVLLHAAGSSPKALSRMSLGFEKLLGRTITPALPRSVTRHSSFGPLRQHIDIATQALASSENERCVLFGHSFGGLVGLLTLLDGARVDVAVLYEPIVVACLDECDPLDVAARNQDRELIDYLAERTEADDPAPGLARFVEAYNEVAWETLPEGPRRAMVKGASGMVELTQSVHHHPIDRERLAKLDVPVLVLHGDRSPEVAQRMATRLHALLPHSELATLEHAGHMAPVLEPDRTLAAVAAFLTAR